MAEIRIVLASRWAGYTLVELLIVLSLIVSVLALTIPSFRRPLSRSRVGLAALNLNERMADAQHLAVERGVPVEMAFSDQGRTAIFRTLGAAAEPRGVGAPSDVAALSDLAGDVLPDLPDTALAGDTTSSFAPDTTSAHVSRSAQIPLEQELDALQIELEVGLYLTTHPEPPASVQPDDLNVPALAAVDTASDVDSADLGLLHSALPTESIVFFPDGRSTSRIFWVCDERSRVGVTVRGLTGTTSVGPAGPHPQRLPEPEEGNVAWQ
ncbi:MAG: hypothetical protein KDA60_00340 [Planctomycetales bacterium]|nr:hypothetical protein [Planctomycetales bacterium]